MESNYIKDGRQRMDLTSFAMITGKTPISNESTLVLGYCITDETVNLS